MQQEDASVEIDKSVADDVGHLPCQGDTMGILTSVLDVMLLGCCGSFVSRR
jgi:hypothetical protein